jgi:hypothetical protein
MSRGGRRGVWVLQLDVQSFFVTIQRPILRDLLLKHCRNSMMAYLIEVIFSHDSRIKVKCLTRDHRNLIGPGKSWFDKPKDSGIPIGNLTSQFAANAYLNDLDHFIVRKLKPAGYLRYMDDLTLLGLEPEGLSKNIPTIDGWLTEFRGQNFNSKKTSLAMLSDGIDYLGVKIVQDFSTNRGVKFYCSPKQKWGFVKRAKELERQELPTSPIIDALTYLKGNSKRNNSLSAINSYLGLIKHTQTFQLRKKTLTKFEKKILEESYVETSKYFTSIIFK